MLLENYNKRRDARAVQAVIYSGRLGDWYNGMGVQTLAPRKNFSSFLFSVAFQQKNMLK